ncbi:transposase [Faecalicoccus pleomorphus]|uniref:transposase n=1 Tax=Faecalicoccus pleomorphus TaxID=1323 RepID=UPI001960F2A8|nr:transposase [Faecalicoccus pleomorphus]MBM6809392.1 transposase [Faecalicoccus pleomorphus]
MNWKINEEGFKICPDGRVFDQYGYDRIQYTRNDNLSITQIYTEKNHCEGCPLKEECTKGKYRAYGKNVILNELQEKVKENLSTSEGQEMKKERSIQVEGAFIE